ncbi:MAG: putative toxin-antitoxin system toxin component, PIN family [Acidobacteriaceae bacterium]|nr:putative toxin-antitoxin system toxin component, PIN family [Acidobacteriaceae bacterium]
MRAVFDSNVWISAFRFKGRPLELVLKAAEGEFELYTSQSIMDETARVLREKFNAQQPEIDEALKIMSAAARKVEPSINLDVVKDDPKDNHVIECAVAARAHVIVTGDKKHLLKMREYQGIKMMQVAEFLGQQRGR